MNYSNKYVWNEPLLKVPKEVIAFKKNGDAFEKSPLTKKLNISKMMKKPSIKLQFSDDNKFHLVANTGKDMKNNIFKEVQENLSKKLEGHKEKVNMLVDDYKKIEDELHVLKFPKKKLKEKDLLKNETRVNELKKNKGDLEEEFKTYMKKHNLVDRGITRAYTMLSSSVGRNRMEFIN